jgi:hypothetical protein
MGCALELEIILYKKSSIDCREQHIYIARHGCSVHNDARSQAEKSGADREKEMSSEAQTASISRWSFRQWKETQRAEKLA